MRQGQGSRSSISKLHMRSALAAILAATAAAQAVSPLGAIAWMQATLNLEQPIQGAFSFSYFNDTNLLLVEYNITGLPDGNYTYHVHEFGDITGPTAMACVRAEPREPAGRAATSSGTAATAVLAHRCR